MKKITLFILLMTFSLGYSQDPATGPTDPIARNAWDVISFYNDGQYTTSVNTPTWGGETSSVTIAGNTTRFLSQYTFGQINFASTNVSAMTTLHVDIYSANQNPTWIRLNGVQYVVATPIGTWTSLEIPLSNFSGAALGGLRRI